MTQEQQQKILSNLMTLTREQLVSLVMRQEREIDYLLQQQELLDVENDQILKDVNSNPMYLVYPNNKTH